MSCSTLNNVIIFTVGAVLGSAVTWRLLKEKYAKIAEDEIISVRNMYTKSYTQGTDKKPDDVEYVATESDVEQYAKILNNVGYSRCSNEKEEGGNSMSDNTPYVISPEEYSENDNYTNVTLIYYADGVLADERGIIVNDVNDLVGEDSLKHFGEYEDDSVFVRNDSKKTDYEILLEYRNYYED